MATFKKLIMQGNIETKPKIITFQNNEILKERKGLALHAVGNNATNDSFSDLIKIVNNGIFRSQTNTDNTYILPDTKIPQLLMDTNKEYTYAVASQKKETLGDNYLLFFNKFVTDNDIYKEFDRFSISKIVSAKVDNSKLYIYLNNNLKAHEIDRRREFYNKELVGIKKKIVFNQY